ncbi:NAD-dependent epimerase/dehydratase family protein [Butyrivibrio sp. XPD2006]|uniref:NAD-dependent epimerase/dehydratase family protein n=1 Tax=Butyrivibrio sp. XPD2006 TaxID=1280668 RepID=UPI0003B58BC8|nr:NAD-dependent epimerase/dehydratase family protein [Butyrivibrio sp. XPD2006]
MNYNSIYRSDLLETVKKIPGLDTLFTKTIMITGANGMIGSAIIDVLMLANEVYNLNIQVIAAVRSIEKAKKRFINWETSSFIDYIEYDAVAFDTKPSGIDFIIHSAGYASPIYYGTNPVEVMKVNILGIAKLLDYAKENKNTRVIYISSSEIYGRLSSKVLWSENDIGAIDILNPRNCYSSSKRAAETLCISYFQEYDVDTVIVRPGHIYGPTAIASDNKVSSYFAKCAMAKKDIHLKSSGNQIRSYCYVLDCAGGIIATMLHGKSAEAYNIANPDSNISIRELAFAFADAGNVQVKFDNPSDAEISIFNPMDCSALDAQKLTNIGWMSSFTKEKGVYSTLAGIYK